MHSTHCLISTQVVAGFHAAMRSQKSIERRARHAADDREALTALLANMATVETVSDAACREINICPVDGFRWGGAGSFGARSRPGAGGAVGDAHR